MFVVSSMGMPSSAGGGGDFLRWCLAIRLRRTPGEVLRKDSVNTGHWQDRGWDPWEACLHRAQEWVLAGLAAHRPHGERYRGETRRAVPALLLGLCPRTLDPRRSTGTSRGPWTGGGGQAGPERREAGQGVRVTLEQRVRRRSHNREGSSQRDGRVGRVDDLGRRKGREIREARTRHQPAGGGVTWPAVS